ncbi:MAG TPA: hypothetical protein GXX51_00290 [Firmicutes bacterium]|nr:hypothetical protein [Bacillota bacterium]
MGVGVDPNVEEVDLLEYARVLWRWKWSIFILVVAAVVASYIISSRMTPIYETTTTILVKDSSEAVNMPFLQALGGQTGASAQNYVEILRSRTLMEHVVRRLGLGAPVGSEEFARLKNAVSVQPVQGTDAIRISVQSSDPGEAARIANTLVDVFIEENQRSNQAATRSAREFIGQQLKTAKENLKRAEDALLAYKKTHRVIEPGEEAKARIEEIASLQKLEAEAGTDIEEARASLVQVRKELERQDPKLVASQTISLNPLVQEYKAKLSELEASLAAAQEKYTEKHPAVIALKAEIEGVKKSLSAEVTRIVSAETVALNPIHQDLMGRAIAAEAQIIGAEAKRDAIARLIAEKEAALERLPQTEIDLARLMRDQRVAEEIYVMLLTKHEEMRITESMKLANIQRIDPAIIPDRPIKPRKLLNVAIAALLALFVGCGFAFVMEYIDNSFKTPEEIEKYLGLPVLGTIPHMDRVRRRKRRHLGPESAQPGL